MRDNVTGILYCSEHSSFMDAVNSGELSSCSKCGMRYSRTHSVFASGSCPACGTLLLPQASVVVPYARKGENDRVRQHIDPLLEDVAKRLQAADLAIGSWTTHETYGGGTHVTAWLRVDPAPQTTLNRDQLVESIKESVQDIEFPSGSYIDCDGRVELHKRTLP